MLFYNCRQGWLSKKALDTIFHAKHCQRASGQRTLSRLCNSQPSAAVVKILPGLMLGWWTARKNCNQPVTAHEAKCRLHVEEALIY